MKKYFKLLFTFLMAFIVIGTVDAATYKVEIKNANANHTYEAYQIFKGDLSGDKLTLSNIVWGANVDETWRNSLKNADDSQMTANDYAKTITEANAKAKAIELGSHLTGTPVGSTNTIENGTYTIDGLEPGYYLVKDKDGTQAGRDEAYTEYIVKLVGDTEVTPKTGKPTSDKNIVETTNVKNSSKYAVGDPVKYELKGTLPSNYDNYTTYAYTFHDKLDAGLTLDTTSIVVKVDGTAITSGYTIKVNDTVIDGSETTTEYAGAKLDIVFANTKTVTAITKDSVITVEYIAKVNSAAVRGVTGNKNTLVIEFTNNPYTGETGKTTEVITKVFIFDLVFKKIDSKDLTALNGAGFRLDRCTQFNANNECTKWTAWATIQHNDSNVFTFEGLSVGTYKLTETTTPDGYNTLSPVVFEVTAVDTDGLTELNGTEFEFVADENLATLTADVKNVKGVVLPLTGGMGTIIFTVIGSMLMAVAAIGILRNKEEK